MSTVTYGTYTITNELEGSQFWTASNNPTTPNYTFPISDLTGDTNADIKIGDIILQGYYRYTVLSVDTTTVLTGNRTSLKGVDGISPTVKSIICSHAAVVCEKTGAYNPSTVTLTGQALFEETIESYSGYFVVELSSDGENWVTDYSSSSKESSIDYHIPLGVNISKNGILYSDSSIHINGTIVDSSFVISSEGVITTSEDIGFIIRSIRCSLYSDANKTILIDQQRINIAFDGVDGGKGDDGYTVVLTNENHTFSGNTTTAVPAYTDCDVIAYIGNVQTSCGIGTITGCPTGMTTTILNNNTTTAKFRVTVTSAMTTQNGVLNIPVTVDDKTFNMKFTYSLKLNGLDATGLGWKVNYSSLTTPNNGECVYYGFDETTKEPSVNSSNHAWVLWNGEEVTIPTGCFVNPNDTMPYNTVIYSVYRLSSVNDTTQGTFHDVAWDEDTNTWISNTYTDNTPITDVNFWTWNEATDIILSMYIEPSNEGAITNAQLFIPPKKYSELVEVAKGMAKEAEKVANNYLSADNTGIMIADLSDGRQSPSEATGKNVFINNESVIIRNGTTPLATYGESITIGKTGTTDNNIYINSNGMDIRKGTVSLAHYGDSIRIGESNNNNIQLSSESFTGNKYIRVNTNSNSQYKSVEVFNVTIGGGIISEKSDLTYKVSGNSVTCNVTCSDQLEDSSIINMYGEIYLEDGRFFSTNIITRPYDSLTEELISEVVQIIWKNENNVSQTLNCNFDYDVSSLQTTFSVNDANSTTKVSSIRLTISYLGSETSYPHYRFGVHNEYSENESEYAYGNFSFDVGENNITSGNYSSARGINNISSGLGSNAEGGECLASGDYSFANGNKCVSSGVCAVSTGLDNQANGDYSNAFGTGNITRYNGQTIVGNYAPIGTSDDLFVVGNGSKNGTTGVVSRSSAMRLKNDGRVEFAGAVGSGLSWNSRTEMINKMKVLSLYKPYQFFASSTVSEGNTIYWGTTAGATNANAFGTICKMSTTTWSMFFMCGGNMYQSTFSMDSADSVTGTFNTKQLAVVAT